MIFIANKKRKKNMSSLYPLKFQSIYKEKIWGGQKIRTLLHKDFGTLKNCGESWEVSGIEDEVSVVTNGFLAENELVDLIEIYMGDLVGDAVFEQFGLGFPLLIKFIDTNDILSVQVHPNDDFTDEENPIYGKNEMWYILEADPYANLINGFKRDTNRSEFMHFLADRKLGDLVNFEPVAKGDVFNIPAGRIHAIGKGICLVEIQQSSDTTYRVYDWERKDNQGNNRELHLDEALDVLDFKSIDAHKNMYSVLPNKSSQINKTPFFTANIIQFTKQTFLDYSAIDSFVIFICVEGEFMIQYNTTERSESIKMGDTVLLPAILKQITLLPIVKGKILEVYIEKN